MGFSFPDTNFGQGVQGAAGGAMAGSALLPGIGTAIGGGLGLLAGLFGGGGQDDLRQQLAQLATQYGRTPPPQMGPAAQAGGSPYEAQRAGYLQQLQGWANGTGPSAAAMQMRDAMERAGQSQSALAAGAAARGGAGPGGALRQAANNTAAIQAQGARDTSILRSQEQMHAIDQLGGALQGAIGQNQDLSQFNAAQQNAVAQANLEAKLRAMGITSQAQLQALVAALGGAPPGLGTSILAGGASVAPFFAGQRAAGRAQGGLTSGGVMNGSQGSPMLPDPIDGANGGGLAPV